MRRRAWSCFWALCRGNCRKAGGIPPSADGGLLCPRRLVVAKSACLRFRLAAKTAPAPLLLLFPADPLRWASPGCTDEIHQNAAGGRGRRALRAHRTAYPRTPVTGAAPETDLNPSGAQSQECLPAAPSGPTGALSGRKFAAGAVPELRLGWPSQRFWPVFRRRGGYQPPAKPSP